MKMPRYKKRVILSTVERSTRFSLGMTLVVSLTLAACTTKLDIRTQVEKSIKEASGSIAEIKDHGVAAVQPVIDTAKSVQKRAETVQTGIQLIREGVHAIGSGTKVSW